MKRNVLMNRIKPVAATIALSATLAAISASNVWGGTPKDVVNGQSDLTADATYSPATTPSATDDIRWTAINYSPSTFTISGATTLNYGSLNNLATNAITIQNGTAATAASLILNGGANSVAPNATDLLYVPTGSALTIQNGTGTLGLTLAATATGTNLNVGGTVTINSAVTSTSGNTFTKTGTGTLTLGANNLATNLANFVVAAGTLNNAQTSALGAGTLTLGVSGGGDAAITDGANVNLTNNINVASGAVGTLRLAGAAAGQEPTFTGNVTLASGANVTLGAGGASTANVRFSGTITGGATNTITIDGGAARVNISGNNSATLTSAINVISGTLNNGSNNGSLGGAAAGAGGQINLGATSGSATATITNGNFNVNNNIVVTTGSGVRRIGGNNNSATGVAGTYRGSLTVNGDVTLGLGDQTGAANNAFGANFTTGTLGGAGTITIDAGTNPAAAFTRGFINLSFAGNTSTSNINVTTGDLRTGNAAALSTGNTVAVGTGTRFDLTGSAATIAGLNDLAGAGGTVGVSSNNTRLLTIGGSGTYAFSGVLANNFGSGTGVLQLTKSGAGTQTLSGPNTYTGLTTINGGVLKLGNISALGTSAITLASGGTLDLNGNAITNGFGINQTRGTLTNTGAAVDLSTTTIDNSGAFTLDGTGDMTIGRITGGNGNAIVKNGNNTVTLAGSLDNSFLGATVNAGTLVLSKASTGSVHALGGSISGSIGGTIKLGGSGDDQIFNPATFTLAGGKFDTSGLSETTGTFSLTADSTLELGTGASLLTFGGSGVGAWTGKLTIDNWSGSLTGGGIDQVRFTGISIANFQAAVDPNEVLFSGFGSGYSIVGVDNNFELVAIPEPGSVGLLAGGVGLLLGLRRNRRR